jgi:hypothetical protein
MAIALKDKLLDEYGAPIVGATVELWEEGGVSATSSTVTNGSGVWEFPACDETKTWRVFLMSAGAQKRELYGGGKYQVAELQAKTKLVTPHGQVLQSTDHLVTETGSENLSNKTLIAPIVGDPELNRPVVADYMDILEVAKPAAPAVGRRRFYAKSDGSLYSEDSAGVESTVGEVESATAVGTVGVGGCTTTQITIPSCRKLLSVFINRLRVETATRVDATTISYGETRVAGDKVVVLYVAS